MLNIYIGWDKAEKEAYEVAKNSLCRHATGVFHVEPLDAEVLYDQRMLWRPVTTYVKHMRDHLSDAPQSTEFATSRFLVPTICRTGWALFTDCDVVFLDDVQKIMEYADPSKAVCVVKHDHQPKETEKMGGAPQTAYYRKNWSSVMLWNCDHLANHRLTLGMINWWPGLLLHRFSWLKDDEIGELPPEWNWLVGVQEKPENPKIAHFTLGGPWIDGWKGGPHDDIWLENS